MGKGGVATRSQEEWSSGKQARAIAQTTLATRRVRIIVADDQRLCRECLRLLIESIDPELSVVEADSVSRINSILEQRSDPSVVLYNLVLTDSHGIDFVRTLSRSIKDIPLVVMCDKNDPELMRGCLERGAKAFLPSTTPGPLLVAVLHLVIAGGSYTPPDLLLDFSAGRLRSDSGKDASIRRQAAITENFPVLTPRQRDVLVQLSLGRSNREIADLLDMCENTVKAHVKQVMRKLRADNRTQAALMADRVAG